jgi:hypothetical protein
LHATISAPAITLEASDGYSSIPLIYAIQGKHEGVGLRIENTKISQRRIDLV